LSNVKNDSLEEDKKMPAPDAMMDFSPLEGIRADPVP
jgi:hypothetical protein